MDVAVFSQLLIFPEDGGFYENIQDCRWTLTSSDPNSRIRIDFESFDTEACCDYLLVSKWTKIFFFS